MTTLKASLPRQANNLSMNIANNETNERIRTVFLSLIREKGYNKTTFKEVASVSGMTRQNLYYYYDSKEGMLQDVIEEFFDRLYQKMLHYKMTPGEAIDKGMSEALVREIAEALVDDIEIARCFYSKDIEEFFIKKEIAFLKRMLGSVIRELGIEVNDPQYIHYLSLQIAGATHFPLKEWLLNATGFSIDKMVELGYPMLESAVATLLKN